MPEVGFQFSLKGFSAVYEITQLLPEWFIWHGLEMSNLRNDKAVVKLVSGSDVKFDQIAKHGECVFCFDCCKVEDIIKVN